MPEFTDCYRLVTFAPPEAVRELAKCVSALIPARDDYDHVAWWSAEGTEQFRPLPGSNPTRGDVGEITRAPSVRIEFTLPKDDALLEKLITDGIQKHHPWEKPVILVFGHRLY